METKENQKIKQGSIQTADVRKGMMNYVWKQPEEIKFNNQTIEEIKKETDERIEELEKKAESLAEELKRYNEKVEHLEKVIEETIRGFITK